MTTGRKQHPPRGALRLAGDCLFSRRNNGTLRNNDFQRHRTKPNFLQPAESRERAFLAEIYVIVRDVLFQHRVRPDARSIALFNREELFRRHAGTIMQTAQQSFGLP